MGLLGLILFLMFFYRYFSFNRLVVRRSGEKAFHVFSIALMGLIVIHSSSTAVFAFSNLGHQHATMQLLAVLLTGQSVLASQVLQQSQNIRDMEGQ